MASSDPLIRSDSLSLVTVMCHSIPDAVRFYVGTLDFNLKCDEEINGERFVIAMPPNLVEFTPTASLRFREATTEKDKRAVGNQAGDGVFLQIETDCWRQVYEKLKTMGTKMVDKEPRQGKDYQAVTVFDTLGNKVTIVEKTTTTIGKVFTKDAGH
jgi:catechol 2,3-dioxygenase-like lactoylglutathione lyase family enzyme